MIKELIEKANLKELAFLFGLLKRLNNNHF
jgi:hypothetical protein